MTKKSKTRKAAAAAKTSAPDCDPIFTLIAEHQAECDHLTRISSADEDVFDAAAAVEYRKLKALITPKPATLAGLAALAEYVVSYFERQCSWFPSPAEPCECALASIAESLRGLTAGRLA